MVKTCCAPKCRNRSKTPGISFFCFPKAPNLRREWIRRVNKANFQPTRHTVLCSDHFPSDSFLSESVPEFLQLIGLEQRPIRRRLKHGALPVLFKRTRDGWEEGECDKDKEAEEKDDGKEEDGMEEESDDEGRFVIQMDVAEEERESESQSPSSSHQDQPMDALPSGSPAQPSDESVKETSDIRKETPALQLQDDNKENRSSRPRRSCRARGADGEGLKKECQSSQAAEPPGTVAESEDRETTNAEERDEERDGDDPEADNPQQNDPGDKDHESEEPEEETRLFTIESVRTVNENDEIKGLGGETDGGRGCGEEGSGTCSPDAATRASPPLPKKLKSSRKKPSPRPVRTEPPRSILPIPQPSSCGPILCRIDPAFCKFQPVFEVPFASSPTFFNRTADSMVNASKIANSAVNSDSPGSPENETSPSEPAAVQVSGRDAPDSATAAATAAPACDSPSTVASPVCTLPCCSTKPGGGAPITKPVHIKQEVPDADDSALPKCRSSELPPLEALEPRPGAPGVPRPSPAGDIRYRSDPISTSRSANEASRCIPYRSEPLRKLPVANTPLSSLLDYRDKAQRSLTQNLLLQKLDRAPQGKVYGSCPAGGAGDCVKGAGGGPRALLTRQLLTGKSGSASVPVAPKKSSAGDGLHSHPTTTSLSTPPHPKVTTQAPDPVTSSTPGISLGPIFIRRDHILADLLDIFKHSADRVHRLTVFRLCHNVTTSPASAGARLQDNWEDVPHKKLFPMFWKECIKVYFDGNEQKVPRIDAQNSSSDVPYILGKILRHGFVLCGYWPVALSPACAVTVFTGEKCSQELFLHSLRKAMFVFEAQALEDLRDSAREGGERFRETRSERRISVVLQAYGGSHCKVPAKADEVEAFVVELADYYLYCQPFWWLREMRRGLLAVTEHTRQSQTYLTGMTEQEVVNMYLTLEPTPQLLLQRTTFRMDDNKQVSQNRIKGFLERCLLRLSRSELVHLLLLWSHADCLLDDTYYVTFSSASNSATGGAPPLFRPSQNTLVLGQSSLTYELFHSMFRKLLEDAPSGL